MEQTVKKKFGIRDIMTIAAMMVITYLIAMVIGSVTLPFPVVYLYGSAGIDAFIGAIFYLVAANRVNKHGLLFAWAAVYGIIQGVMGYMFLIPYFLVVALIAELTMLGKNTYRNAARNRIGWTVNAMNATEEQVMAAAKAAYCDEFIQRLPDGYQTVLGENGSTLSGGERQRISIARALLKDAPIILLDEATASLDPENEILIQRAIAKLVEGKTVIMIAHRLRTVVDADQIIVLEDGKLAELGTHKELMEKKGLYEKLYHIQQESLGWAI